MMKIFLPLIFLIPSLSFAIGEEDFRRNYDEKVRPFYNKGVSGLFKATVSSKKGEPKNVENGYHIIKRGGDTAIVILPGRTEPVIKYAELAYDLKDLTSDFYIVNHRGQGESSRLVEDPHKGYIREYENFRKDFKIFLDKFVLNQNYKKIHLIAHSMGGAIALDFLTHYKNPFASVTTSAPMLEIETGKYSHRMAKLLSRSFILLGKGRDYAIGHGKGAHDTPFTESRVTSSQVRHEIARDLERENEYLLMGGVTNRWVNVTIKAGEKMFKEMHKNKKRLEQVPLLMFQAGVDHFVRPTRQNLICEALENCQMFRFDEAKHEILQERDSIRDEALAKIIKHIQSH